MKKFILPLLMLAIATSAHASWFNSSQEQQEINRLHDQLQQQQHHNDAAGVIIVALGVGCFATLITGTIIGSRARRKVNADQ